MEKNWPITIHQVGNGFIVHLAFDEVPRGEMIPEAEKLVFQSMAGLIDFMKGHFAHRQQQIEMD